MATGQASPKRGKVVDLPEAIITIGTATDGGTGTTASVAFTASSPTTGGPFNSFTATSNPGSFTNTGGSSPVVVSGLTADTAYTFTVKATNGTGSGPVSSASNSVTPSLPNSYEAIATLSGTGSSDTITFSSIPNTYKHLQIRGIQVVDYGSSDYGNAGVRFNGDSNYNYTTHAMRGYYDTTANQQGINYTLGGAGVTYGMILGAYLGSNTNTMFPTIIDILNYANTGNRKVAKGWSGSTYLNNSSANRGFLQTASTFWDSTAAINSISLFASNGSWNTKTKFTLYGIKDS
jgi:hypothetical protein